MLVSSILKEISPGFSLKGMMLKLKLQYFGHLMRRVDSLEDSDGRDWGQEEKGTTEDEMAGWHHRLDGCESWTMKKAECRRTDAFELWCWRRLLRVPWTARRCNQSILKEISPGCSLERLMLKLKLQYFGHLM